MTIPLDAAITLFATGGGLIFLAVSAWHNHHQGFRKTRRVESPLDEALLWLGSVNERLSDAEISAAPTGVPTSLGMITATEQLLKLHSALQQQESPVAAQPAESVSTLRAA